MFSLNGVMIRPFEIDDIDTLYKWDMDNDLEILAGWGGKRSRAAYRNKYEQQITEPRDDFYMFGIEVGNQLVGYLQLAHIDNTNRHAAIGILIGEKEVWGQGVGANALRLLIDYTFTVKGLERVYAEIYGFNARSLHLFEKIGFQQEGILRQHEFHNGSLRDLYVFGLLKPEFYQRYETIFKLPE